MRRETATFGQKIPNLLSFRDSHPFSHTAGTWAICQGLHPRLKLVQSSWRSEKLLSSTPPLEGAVQSFPPGRNAKSFSKVRSGSWQSSVEQGLSPSSFWSSVGKGVLKLCCWKLLVLKLLWLKAVLLKLLFSEAALLFLKLLSVKLCLLEAALVKALLEAALCQAALVEAALCQSSSWSCSLSSCSCWSCSCQSSSWSCSCQSSSG